MSTEDGETKKKKKKDKSDAQNDEESIERKNKGVFIDTKHAV